VKVLGSVLSKWWTKALLVGLAFVFLYWIHPYIFGFPGRLHERTFERALRVGMPRSGTIQIAKRLDGRSMFDDSWLPPSKPWSRETNPRTLDIIFDDSVTFCIVSGKWYHLTFDARTHLLLRWDIQDWGSAC
jgi:hypothetical protein